MKLLTDEASEQLSRGVSATLGGLFGTSLLLALAAVAYAPVGFVVVYSPFGLEVPGKSVILATWEWLWTDQTPAYFISSVTSMSLIYLKYKLGGAKSTAGAESSDPSQEFRRDRLINNLSSTLKMMFGVNVTTIVVISGVIAGVAVSKTSAAPLAVAVAFVYPIVDVRLSETARLVPTPVVVVAVLSAPLAVIPTLYTVPFHAGTIVSKRFAGVVTRATSGLLSFTTRVADAAPEPGQLPSRLSPRRRT